MLARSPERPTFMIFQADTRTRGDPKNSIVISITLKEAPIMSRPAPVREHCCDCIPTQNRCGTDGCPCFVAKRICDEPCESSKFRGDCLNQAICKCSCEAPELPADAGAAGASKNSTSTTAATAKVCAKAERCECLRIKETCSKLCACKQNCKNRESKKPQQGAVVVPAKLSKPTQGCACSRSKKQCLKRECPCRAVYEFCTSGKCKCSGDCTNGPSKFTIPKHVQQCFLEHKHESSAIILTLIGDDYIYRTDFFHESKNEPHVEEQVVTSVYDLTSKWKTDLYEILIYVSKSPCFHQDCDPKCEVIDECRSNKACSKLLGLLLCKVRKELGKVDVKMTVKFLYPHLARGDLYTKQGLLCMLQSGIKVEPLLMKDWSAIMDWAPHSEHKGEYLQLWNSHHLDKAVCQTQSFINECRRALGLPMKFWVAEIHEIVKNTILHYADIRNKLHELNEALKCLDLTATPHKIRSTPSKRRSFIDMLELRDKLHLTGNHTDRSTGKSKDGSQASLPGEDAQTQQMVASLCGRSFDDTETNEIAQRIRRATTNIHLEIESLLEYLNQKGNS